MSNRAPGPNVTDLRAAFERIFKEQFTEDYHALWWVRPPMVRLAVHAAIDLPSEVMDYQHEYRPAARGLLIWEGGNGLVCPRRLFEPEYQIMGAIWGLEHPNAIIPLTWAPHLGGIVIPPVTAMTDDLDAIGARVSAMLHASWILADQPTVAQTSFLTSTGADTVQVDWRTMQPKPELPRQITVATLREMQKPAEPSERTGAEDAKWHLTKRHYVRGHWRSQAFGKARQQRRPVFVPPYIKGPDGTPLADQTPLVHIWRR